MRVSVHCAALLASLAAMTAASAADPTPREAAIAAFEAAECRLTRSALDEVMLANGFDNSAIDQVALALYKEGALTFEQGGDVAVLGIGEACANARASAERASPEARAAVIAAFEANDCRIEPDGAVFAELRDALSKTDLDGALVELANEKALRISMEALTLATGPVCAE